jgi:hypothetical protein
MRAKHIIGYFEWFFEGGKTFGPSKCPERSEGRFCSRQSQGPLKNLKKSLILCFFNIQKIISQTIRNSGAFVFLCTGATIWPNFFVLLIFYIVF